MNRQGLAPRHLAVLAACCVQCLIPGAMILNAQGIFYPAVSADLGVQTAEITAWVSVAFIASAAFSILVGNLLTRYRLKTMRIIAVVVAGLVMFAFSLATAPWMFWVSAIGAGYVIVVAVSLGPATVINRWFHHKVGMAMGIYAASSAIGGVIFLMIGQAIIDTAGWRQAYQVFAAIILLVALPVELLCNRESPEDCGLLPYGAFILKGKAGEDMAVAAEASDEGSSSRPESSQGPDSSASVIAQANRLMLSAPFWLLALTGLLMNLVCQLHGYFPKYVLWVDEQAALGLSATAFVAGAVLASACQTGSAIGKIILGSFSDFSVRNAVVALGSCGIVGVSCVWLLPSTFLLPVGALVFGFFLSSVLVLLPMLCREAFGAGDIYPVLYARVSVAATFGGAAGNIVWPFFADNLGGFAAVFGTAIVFMAVVVLASLAALALARRESKQQI